MPRINALTTIHVTGYILVEDALPVRQKPGTQVQRSPYSPPIRHLAEEITSTYFVGDVQKIVPKVTLIHIEMHSRDIATFTFESQTPIDIVPGQATILDLKPFVGTLPYQHMAPWNPKSVNDDSIRTWTVSGSSRWAGAGLSPGSTDATAGPLSFSLTMRHKPGGAVTNALFAIAHKLSEARPELLEDARPLELNVPLIGVAGDFTLPVCRDACSSIREPSTHTGARKLLWIAGGIGVTPFLAMLASLTEKKSYSGCERECGDGDDIVLLLSTREPDVLLPLIVRALECTGDRLDDNEHPGRLIIHVFSRSSFPSSPLLRTVNRTMLSIKHHEGRLKKETLGELNLDNVKDRQTYVCGPEDFEEVVLAALKEMGVDSQNIKREGFAY